MTTITPEEIHAEVARAIERQEYNGGRESLFNVLQAAAPNSCDYWYEVACELHRREKFYDSLVCWFEAEKYIGNCTREPLDWYEDMISTLMNATDQSEDEYFREEALSACDRLIVLDPSEDALNYVLELRKCL